jgi:hypothetical protein
MTLRIRNSPMMMKKKYKKRKRILIIIIKTIFIGVKIKNDVEKPGRYEIKRTQKKLNLRDQRE